MKTSVGLALWTAGLEGLCFLAFVVLASTTWAGVGKSLAIVVGFATAVTSAWLGASYSPREIGRYAAVVACGNVALLEVLAYTAYPGLAKDMAFVSTEHALRAVVVLMISFAGHFVLALVLRVMRRKVTLREA